MISVTFNVSCYLFVCIPTRGPQVETYANILINANYYPCQIQCVCRELAFCTDLGPGMNVWTKNEIYEHSTYKDVESQQGD